MEKIGLSTQISVTNKNQSLLGALWNNAGHHTSSNYPLEGYKASTHIMESEIPAFNETYAATIFYDAIPKRAKVYEAR